MRLNAAAGRLERDEAGQVIFADYRRGEGRLILDHVEAPLALRGSGAAGRLMEEIAAYAREHELLIVPLCGYAAHWLRRKSEYSDLVAP